MPPAFSVPARRLGGWTGKRACFSPPAARSCCSWRIPGWPPLSPSTPTRSPIRIGRFHRTFATVFTMVFGGTEQALAAAPPAAPPARRDRRGSRRRCRPFSFRFAFAPTNWRPCAGCSRRYRQRARRLRVGQPAPLGRGTGAVLRGSFGFVALFDIPRAALPGERRAFSVILRDAGFGQSRPR